MLSDAEGASDRLVGRGYEEFNKVIREEGKIAMSSNPRQQTEQLVDHVKDVMIQNMEKVVSFPHLLLLGAILRVAQRHAVLLSRLVGSVCAGS